MSKRVTLDQDKCIGCGTCESICPQVFRLDAELGKSTVIMPEGGPEKLIQEAIDSCPVECISWVE
jgi:ferredoxin